MFCVLQRERKGNKLTKHETNVEYTHVVLAFHRLSLSDLMAKKIVATVQVMMPDYLLQLAFLNFRYT